MREWGPMPTDALLLSLAICGVLTLFAAVLAWVDHSTGAWLRAKAATARSPEAQPAKKAA
jgi:hypothetical protein